MWWNFIRSKGIVGNLTRNCIFQSFFGMWWLLLGSWREYRFGVYMRHVTISYRRPKYSNRRKLVKEITEVLKLLSIYTSLTSFKMQRLTLHHKWISDRARKNLVNATMFFLCNQGKLKRLDLSNSDCHRWEATYILLYLSKRNAGTLEELYLKNFLETKLELINFPSYRALLYSMPNLRILSVNCSSINANLLMAMTRGLESLEHLIVTCRRKDRPRMLFTTQIWNDFTFRMPRVKLHFSFEKVHRLKAICKLLPKGVPLQSFRYVADTLTPPDSGNHLPKYLPDLASHLCQNFSVMLGVVELDMGKIRNHTLSTSLAVLVTNLPGLRVLRVKASMSAADWSSLIEICTERGFEVHEMGNAGDSVEPIEGNKKKKVLFVKRLAVCIRVPPKTWCDLPEDILCKIFKYLSCEDRTSVSFTCLTWKKAVHNPNVWRCVQCYYPRRCAYFPRRGATDWILKYRNKIESVFIYTTPQVEKRNEIKRELCQLLVELKNCTSLKRISCKKLTIFENELDTCRRMTVLHYIQLLGSCPSLEVLRFPNARCFDWEADALMFHIDRTHKRTIVELDVSHFLVNSIRNKTLNMLRTLLGRMPNLKFLSVDVRVLTAKTILELTSTSINLRSIRIQHNRNSITIETPTAEDWIEAKKRCPILTVDFKAEKVHSLKEICKLLPKGVPLQSFRYVADTLTPLDSAKHLPNYLPDLASHLCQNFADTLGVVELDMGKIRNHTLSTSLAVLVTNLPGLRVLRVKASMSAADWSSLIEICTERGFELKELSCGFVDGGLMLDAEQLQMAIASYSPLFERRGIVFSHCEI